MTPPEAPLNGICATKGNPAPAVSLRLEILTKRADFQRASRAKRVATPGFILQMRPRREDEPSAAPIRVGFTCSKKVGNAVARNRAKRRLREIARLTLPQAGRAGMDYVFVGRREATAALPFDQLLADLTRALDILHGARK
ncbi:MULTISPECIES: ribonuclease P protein component [Sulfitobacter]|uniref:Ribonuclease P protein component n=1 Tax=Sulfitobacter profundi TaxID=2679961 RepID=A0ABW1Z170_9RHOB|nr:MULTISPECIES: ribonuclease P protein component [Sulfitobacter]UWR37066.1 ribonuclease P protein component [Sulfitobacter sp. W074]